MRGALPAAALALLLLGGAAAPAAAPATLAIRAAQYYGPDGKSIPDAVVIVKDGRIEAVGPGLPIPKDARVLEAAVACPGFADCWTRTTGGNDAEDPRPFAPALRAADGLDPRDPSAVAAAREGVLTRVLLPSDRNPLGGRAAALHVAGHGGDLATSGKSADLGGVISLCGAALRQDRYPCSLVGLMRALESAFDAAQAEGRDATGDPGLDLGRADRKALLDRGQWWVFARTRAEVRAACDLAKRRLGPRAVLVDPHCGAAEILSAAAAAGTPAQEVYAVLSLDPDDPLLHLRGAGLLAAAGAHVAFGTGGPARGPDAIRLAAALAVRHGMSPDAARGALLGRGFPLPDRGRAGDSADLVLLDGDPVDPASRVLRVLAGGETLPPRGKGNRINE